jgi:D-serine deaminase-like pyridoxal phosphate-dependent protein
MADDSVLESTGPSPKGVSPGFGPAELAQLASAGESLFGGAFSPPMMILKASALVANVDTMARYCRDHRVDLAPHGKTTMAPRIFERQLAAGAWAITVATPAQVAVCRGAGVPRVLLANELVNPAAAEWVLRQLREDPSFDFLCYVDSVAGVSLLANAIAAVRPGRPLDVLLEMGYGGGRTGCRSLAQAIEVGRAAAAVDGLRIVGVSGFEGGLAGDLSSDVYSAVDGFLESIRAAAERLAEAGLAYDRGDGIILSAGGSIFFDRVVSAFVRPLAGGRKGHGVIRSGCYVTHDSGFYERMSPFSRPGAGPEYRLAPALEAWGEILSLPEQGSAIVGLGRRDVPFDLGLPVPRSARRPATGAVVDASGCEATAINDQHLFVRTPAGLDLRVGDWMSAGISHPCTAFDKWQLLPLVDDDYRVVDLIRTFF